MSGGIKVTISDPVTGEVFEEREIENDYLILCAGKRYVDSVQNYPKAGTTQIIVKTERPGEQP